MKTKIKGPIWQNEQLLSKCEVEREQHRKRNGRITFDCTSTKTKGERVLCRRGRFLNSLSDDGSMYLLAVLRGRTAHVCRKCPWFKSE